MTYTISKRFEFSASHVLDGLPSEHPCSRLHGHNWCVTLYLAAQTVDPHGFVVDFVDLAPFKLMLDTTYDHRHLNDVLDVSPTSENLARHLHDAALEWWPQVLACAVSETPRTNAVYCPAGALLMP